MCKRITAFLLSLVLMLALASPSRGFQSDANKDPNTGKPKEYTRENSIKPVGQGGYYGGHDTLTAEGVLLKKKVHQNNSDFQTWANGALPWFRTGAHDEDSTIPLWSDPPMGV